MGVKILAGAMLRPKGRARLEYSKPVDPDEQAVTLISKPPSAVRLVESTPTHMLVENTSEDRSAFVVVTLGNGANAEKHNAWGLLDMLAGVINADVTLTRGGQS